MRSLLTALIFMSAISTTGTSFAETTEERIRLGVQLIKLGCGTGSTSERTEIKGEASGSFTLRKPPGAQAGGTVTYTKDEATGLLAALNKEISAGTLAFGEKQMSCMKPYVDRIFDVIFPKQGGVSVEKKCQAEKIACEDELSGMFNKCIKREMVGCTNDCLRRGFPFDRCVAFMCSYTNISDTSKAFYDNRCLSKDDYISKHTECSSNYSECIKTD